MSKSPDNNKMENWLDLYPPARNAGSNREPPSRRGNSRSPYLNDWLKSEPGKTLDLHGMTGQEAALYLERELHKAWKEGVRKLRIIHGKGLHSQKDAVLPSVVRNILSRSDLVLRHGKEVRENGGDGATWVILKGK